MPTDGVHSPISNKQKHGVARMEDTERPTRLGSGAWGRRQGLAGLRDDAPSEARGADGERAGRRPQAPTRRQAREHKLRGRQAGSSRSGRQAGGPSGRLAAQTPSRQLAARTPSGRAEWAGLAGGPSGWAERAGLAGGPSGRAAATRHQHAEHAHTTRPGPAAPNSAEDPGLVKQSDQTVHHEGGECFERGLDLALGQRCERCDSVVGPGAREFARLIEHVVGAQAFHDRGEGLVGG